MAMRFSNIFETSLINGKTQVPSYDDIFSLSKNALIFKMQSDFFLI